MQGAKWHLTGCGSRAIGTLTNNRRPVELELELIQSHMAQKPVLRGEVECACVAREVSAERGGSGLIVIDNAGVKAGKKGVAWGASGCVGSSPVPGVKHSSLCVLPWCSSGTCTYLRR